ncbi:NADH-ubiquinone oxidoreductase-F iron-sulfur binding region domain-containing protein [Brachyspira sp.]|uniref:NADH-ubiquinone oxidoreductase-F iron-sulfur binding region domain-containing protein n=1 Tax=Brachyspira sp. TaxID=1977261 RepID=UPI003D7DFFF9
MKKYVLHSENIINNIQTYRDYFGDYLHAKISNYDSIINDLKECPIFTRDIYQKSIHDIIASEKNNESALIINGYSMDYLIFKDKFLLKNNPYLILDAAIFLSKILNIKNIDIILRSYYLEEKNILIKALVETEDIYYIDREISINIFDENSYYDNYKEKITVPFLENKKYIFDLETITQFGYFAHIGKNNFEKHGKGNFKGSILLSISGDINIPNLYEFELSTSFNDIIRIAGNIPKDYDIKCVFTNGFLNPPIDMESLSNIYLDYNDFENLNIKIGNGGICFIGENRCIIRTVLKIVFFAKSIACGKCMPCGFGFNLCEYYLNKIILGKSDNSDFNDLKNTLNMIIKGASCLYIKNLANCILQTMEKFNYEFIYAVEKKITLYSFIK